jgi:hypothetical protein
VAITGAGAAAGVAATGADAAASAAGVAAGAAALVAAGAAVSAATAAVCPNTSNNAANAPIIALLQMNRSLIILPPLDFELVTHNVFFGTSSMDTLQLRVRKKCKIPHSSKFYFSTSSFVLTYSDEF